MDHVSLMDPHDGLIRCLLTIGADVLAVATLRPAGGGATSGGSALCAALGSAVGAAGSSSDLPLMAVRVRHGASVAEGGQQGAGSGGGGGGGSAAVEEVELECEALLVATGRVPNVHGLGLEVAGVEYSASDGIKVDDLCATTNKAIYAVGDCVAGVPRFTHMSGEMAKMCVQNALFGDAWRLSSLVVPRCVYTEPEVAAVGLSPQEARRQQLAVDTYTASLAHNDRAIVEGHAARGGFVEVLCREGTDTIVGATVVSAHAGEIVNEITLAMQEGVGLERVARVIHPYPTTAEGVQQAALGYIRKNWSKLPPK